MDEQSLYQLDQTSVLIVPTGSLATHLNEAIAAQQVQRGAEVWEAPNIWSWQEVLRALWQQNRASLSEFHSVLSASQSKLLWSQVIERSKQGNNELTLLNVQQTVRACMRSDRLMADWRCDANALALEHISDVDQFLLWRSEYQAALAKRAVIDEPGLQTAVISLMQNGQFTLPLKHLIWYAYDLVTAAQQCFNDAAANNGAELVFAGPSAKRTRQPEYQIFADDQQELEGVFQQARAALEQNPEQRINIVIPDLQHRYAKVQEVARQTFYPNASLTEVQNNNLVYRLSLGKPMNEWPAIESALCALNLLKNRISTADLSFLCRSVYLARVRRQQRQFIEFEQWLRAQRILHISLEHMPALLAEYDQRPQKQSQGLTQSESAVACDAVVELVEQLIEFKQTLNQRLLEQQQGSGYSTLGFADWATVFSEWLALWGWQSNSAGSDLSTVGHQLLGRWGNTLNEFAGLGAVQRSIGLSNAINSFQQLVRDTVFLPKSAVSPLLISGLFEALGRETDLCFVTGMTQDFPPPAKGDAFIPNQYLLATSYPDASPQSSVQQARKVMQSLVGAAGVAHISYALSSTTDQELLNQPSPLFIDELNDAPITQLSKVPLAPTELQTYTDVYGPVWRSPEKAKGGSAIFKNQSHCAFKAFVTHQLGFDAEQEPEFGLDYLDRGNLTHKMLELIWGQLPNQHALLELSADEQLTMLAQTFDLLLEQSKERLTEDKQRLFALEKDRVIALTDEWLNLERKRPSNFSVVEREAEYHGQWGGIGFKYIIDRVDLMDSGQTAIIDYKTGTVSRNDWQSEHPLEPQLPLYALVHDELKSSAVSGIAFAQVRRGDSKYVELAETDIFNKTNRYTEGYEQDWLRGREQWPLIFTRLAEEFLAGKADVNPVDKKVCDYCDLRAVCRVQELRERSKGLRLDTSSEGQQ